MKTWILTFVLFICFSCAGAQQVQWASKVINYSTQWNYNQYSAKQVLGEPNSTEAGEVATAWSAITDDRREFLQVGFDRPMKIKQVIIVENNAPGAVYRVALFDAMKKEYEIYKQAPDTTLTVSSRFLQIKIDETPYEVVSVKVSIDCRAVKGINQVDAIGIADHLETMRAEMK